jgi:hypothetical protein
MRPLAWTRGMAVDGGKDPGSAPWPRAYGVLLGGLCLLGIALRLSCMVRPYWIDEAWVLNSVASASLDDMFHYRHWLQTTPPGLLLVLRGLYLALPQHLDDLRWLSVASAVATLLSFAWLARSLLGRGAAALACAVFALSPTLVLYATELKQYSFDALAITASLVCGRLYIEQPSSARLWRWTLCATLGLTLSFSAAFNLPALATVAVLVSDEARWRTRVRRLLPHVLLAAGTLAFVYLRYVHPHAGLESLRKFWATGFHAADSGAVLYYWRHNVGLLFDFLHIDTTRLAVLVPCLLASAGGVLGLLLRAGPTPRARALGVLLAMPVLATLVANALGLYPLGLYRMVAFLAPALVLLLALGLEFLFGLPLRRYVRRTGQACIDGLGAVAALVMTVHLAASLNIGWWAPSRDGGALLWRANTEILPALDYLREVDALGRPLFVHAVLEPVFRYYTRDAPLRAPVSFAGSGYPCCIPGRPWRGYLPVREEVSAEVAALEKRHGRRPFHVLLTARPNWPSDDWVGAYSAEFAKRGCAVAWRYDSYRVVLLRVVCGATP